MFTHDSTVKGTDTGFNFSLALQSMNIQDDRIDNIQIANQTTSAGGFYGIPAQRLTFADMTLQSQAIAKAFFDDVAAQVSARIANAAAAQKTA